MAENSGVKAVSKALRALLAFKDSRELSSTELSLILGVHKSSVLDLCSTLMEFGFLQRDPSTKRYRLGLALFDLGSLVQQRMELRSQALPAMRALREELGETVYLVIRDRFEGICIERLDWEESGLQVRSPVGKALPLIRGAARKVLLAHLDPAEQKRVFAAMDFTPLTPASPTAVEPLLVELNEIAGTGYSLDHEEVDPGVTGVGVAIRNHTGEVIASLSVAGPTLRMSPSLQRVIQEAKRAAETISASMGWAGEHAGVRVPGMQASIG